MPPPQRTAGVGPDFHWKIPFSIKNLREFHTPVTSGLHAQSILNMFQDMFQEGSVSTTFELSQLPVDEHSSYFGADRRAVKPAFFSQKLCHDIIGVTGVMITLSVVVAGVYVFCRFLL